MIFRINSKRINVIIGLFFLFVLFLLPLITYSVQSTDTNTGITYECGDNETAGNCDFADLIEAVKKVVTWGTTFALGFSVIVIAYAGFLYMNSGGSPGERAKANKVLLSAAKGIAFIIAAWLIVTLIIKGLGVKTTIKTFLK